MPRLGRGKVLEASPVHWLHLISTSLVVFRPHDPRTMILNNARGGGRVCEYAQYVDQVG